MIFRGELLNFIGFLKNFPYEKTFVPCSCRSTSRHFKVADQRDEKIYFPIWMADSDGKFWLVDIPIRSGHGTSGIRGETYIYIYK